MEGIQQLQSDYKGTTLYAYLDGIPNKDFINVLVVVMILYLVIKTMITNKEFGVMKAMGYSTIQLIHQISISFLPVIISGVVSVLGKFSTNPMLSVLLSPWLMHLSKFYIALLLPLLMIFSKSRKR